MIITSKSVSLSLLLACHWAWGLCKKNHLIPTFGHWAWGLCKKTISFLRFVTAASCSNLTRGSEAKNVRGGIAVSADVSHNRAVTSADSRWDSNICRPFVSFSIRPSIRRFAPSVRPSVHPSVHPSVQLITCSFVRRSSNCPFVRSLVCLSVCR